MAKSLRLSKRQRELDVFDAFLRRQTRRIAHASLAPSVPSPVSEITAPPLTADDSQTWRASHSDFEAQRYYCIRRPASRRYEDCD